MGGFSCRQRLRDSVAFRVIRKAKHYVWRVGEAAASRIILAWVIIRKRSDCDTVIVLSRYIGDSLYGLAYTEAYKSEHPDRRIVVICYEGNRGLVESYSAVDVVICYSKWLVGCFRAFYSSGSLSEIALRHGVINPIAYYHSSCKEDYPCDTLLLYRRDILSLDESARITYHPHRKSPVTAIEDFSSRREKVAIINPFSRSLPVSCSVFFEHVVRVLGASGFEVFTNVADGQDAVEGTTPLECGIEELYEIASGVPLIVSVRSGILDYLVGSGIDIFALYCTDDLKFWDMYHLSGWGCGGVIGEHLLREEDPIEDACLAFDEWFLARDYKLR